MVSSRRCGGRGKLAGQIIEIATNGRSLHLERGFISVREDRETIARVPIDDVEAVLVSAPGVTWSNKALAALAERGSPVVILGSDFMPAAALLPVRGHHNQGRRMRAQSDADKPLRKRLWARLVKAKITAQSEVLQRLGLPCERLRRLCNEVRTGDTTNREALAAQAYWPILMGSEFRRDPSRADANTLLNYGYAVLRAAAARAIVGAGLHPSLSLHHVSDGDALSLADDVMEPFRPAIDIVARDLAKNGQTIEAPESRRVLVSMLQADFQTEAGRTPLSQCLVRLCQSLSAVFLGERKDLILPASALPLEPDLDL